MLVGSTKPLLFLKRSPLRRRIDPGGCVNTPGAWPTWIEADMGKGTPSERFWAKVDTNGPIPSFRPDLGPCWLWTAAIFNEQQGYGVFAPHPKVRTRAHRFAYQLLCGPIPEGMHLDHLCRVRHCVNPDHLEPVTIAENNRRAAAAGCRRMRAICKSGRHILSPGNVSVDRSGRRSCLICRRERARARYLPRPACPRGHAYTEQFVSAGRHRRCLLCHPLSERELLKT